ncbi:MAG: type I restriction endonuclease subunit R [Thaumarchaeota archaeon]|nr:type I restriction endonuclease subunit R [Nitrososphaerota archaeon]
MTSLNESSVEDIALKWLVDLGWKVVHGSDIAPGTTNAARGSFEQVVLEDRLRSALFRLNPNLPEYALDDALRRLIRPDGATVEARNRAFHMMLVDGIRVEYRDDNGTARGAQASVLDADNPANNDWLAVSQFTVKEGRNVRRLDVVLFLNGLPLGIIELKNPSEQQATLKSAWNQLRTYRSQMETLFSMNEILIVSDGPKARIGTLTSEWEWFKNWRSPYDETREQLELQVTLQEVCKPEHFVSLISDFIVFEDDGGGTLNKILAGYHQFYAVRKAIQETVRATSQSKDGRIGDGRIGVVWHTQGSGKSLTMAFYAGMIARKLAMENPTVVVLTDRNDLDNQLFGTFSRCHDILRQHPVQASDRADLRDKLSVAAGGVVFTTIQKFLPEEKGDRHQLLSERRNVIVIADEAHRSQYGFIDGFARHMRDALPHASFIGFTGTPVETADTNTRAVFGDYIDIYDIQRSIEDKSTVPIYYSRRLARLELDEGEMPRIDDNFEEVTEDEESTAQERLKAQWTGLEAIVGSKDRLGQVASDIVSHFEERQKDITGKAMVVCMSRRICVDLYEEIVRARPEWHDDDDDKGSIKIIMTGSASDPLEWGPHVRNKTRRLELAKRFRDAEDPFQIVLVRDMWLTGFDAPSLHTMYVDKPMHGHRLMQAIARVNRVFRDKPGGLVVDYIGLWQSLQYAVAAYTASRGRGNVFTRLEEAADVMQEKYEVCRNMLHGFDWSAWHAGRPDERLKLIPDAQEHVLSLEGGKGRFLKIVGELTRAFALVSTTEEARAVRDDVGFFQTVRKALTTPAPGMRHPDDVDRAIRDMVSRTIESKGVVDVFGYAGLDNPDMSILSDEFLSELASMPQRNLASEVLEKLLRREINQERKRNVVKSRSFAEMLEDAVRRYHDRAIDGMQFFEELMRVAKNMCETKRRGEETGLSEYGLAFYDALVTSESAVRVMGGEKLREIASELVEVVKENTSPNWKYWESERAKIRRAVKRVLRKHGYPPELREDAAHTVLSQAEVFSEFQAGD